MSFLPRMGFSAVLLATVLVASSNAQLNDLARYIPQDANVVMIVDVERLHDSEYGQKNDWDGNHNKAFEDGLTMIPPNSLYFITSTQLDLEFMHPYWTVALAQMAENVPMSEIAERNFGTEDEVAGKPAVMARDDTIIVGLSPGFYGAIVPGNRQNAARWIKAGSAATQPNVAPYLKEALDRVQSLGTPIVMALDVEDMVSEKLIRQRLDRLEILDKRDDVDRDELASLLSGIRGLTLSVEMENIPKGQITIDFNKDCSMLRGYGKFLLIEALANNGAYIDDFKSWEVAFDENQMTLRGGLSSSGMRRIFSLVDQPAASASPSVPVNTQDQGSADQQQMLTSTKQYFNNVETLLGDLDDHKGTARSYGQIGVWFDKYADKIDRLSVLHVDPAMTEYGTFVSQQLRDAAQGIKQGNIQTGAQSRQVWASGGGGGGYGNGSFYGGNPNYGGGYYGPPQMGSRWQYEAEYREVDAQRRAIRAQNKARSSSNARNILTDIRSATGEIRRAMTLKYEVDF